MAEKVNVDYTKGVPVTGDILSWDGRKFVPKQRVYYTQVIFTYDGSGISSGKNYPIGILRVPTGETQTIESIYARTNAAGSLIVYKRVFGSSTFTQILPASGTFTLSSNGSSFSTNMPFDVNNGEELFIGFPLSTLTQIDVVINVKHVIS